VFRVTLEALSFYLFFLFGGTVPFFLVSGDVFSNIVLMSAGVAFSAAGGYGLYVCTTPAIFDKGRGFFWRGRKEPDALFGNIHLKDNVQLQDIHALQLVTNYATDGGSYMYEINLVLNDGRRINVVVQRNVVTARENARTLSQFLERPIWDAL